jgi:hypothetical protein
MRRWRVAATTTRPRTARSQRWADPAHLIDTRFTMLTPFARRIVAATLLAGLALAGCAPAGLPASNQPTSMPTASAQPTLASTAAAAPTTSAQPSQPAPTAVPTPQTVPTVVPVPARTSCPRSATRPGNNSPVPTSMAMVARSGCLLCSTSRSSHARASAIPTSQVRR